MTNTRPERQRRDAWPAVVCGVVVGLVIYVLLVPASAIDRQPPECYAALGYVVPCGDGFSISLAVTGAVVAGALTFVIRRRRR